MRSRSVLLATVLPYALLCALGLGWLSARDGRDGPAPDEGVAIATAPIAPAVPERPSQLPATPAPAPDPRPSLRAPPVTVAAPATWSAQPGLTPEQQRDREAALAHVDPLLKQCVDDEGPASRGPLDLEVRFTLGRSAGAGRASQALVTGDAQYHPMVGACIVDLLEEVTLPTPASPGAFEVHATRPFPVGQAQLESGKVPAHRE